MKTIVVILMSIIFSGCCAIRYEHGFYKGQEMVKKAKKAKKECYYKGFYEGFLLQNLKSEKKGE